jgi:hypothetical protein
LQGKKRKDGYKKHKSKVYSNEITKTSRKEIRSKNAKTKETELQNQNKEENKKRKKEV